MPYIATFLAGIVTWNIFDKATETAKENPVIRIATSAIIMYIGYKFGYKLLKKL